MSIGLISSGFMFIFLMDTELCGISRMWFFQFWIIHIWLHHIWVYHNWIFPLW